MSQTAYSLYMTAGMPGQLADSGYHDIVSFAAEEIIPIGRGVCKGLAESVVKLPNRNSAAVTFSADFVASNVINATVNGVAISPVTYSSSHAVTFAALITALDGLTGISAVAGSGRTIEITVDNNTEIVVSGVVVTLGSSQATATTVYTSDDLFWGLALHTHTLVQTAAGLVQYAAGQTVSVMKKGRAYVQVEQDVAVTDSVYVRTFVDGVKGRGAFRKDSDSGNAVLVSGAKWFKGASSGGFAILELNLP